MDSQSLPDKNSSEGSLSGHVLVDDDEEIVADSKLQLQSSSNDFLGIKSI